MSEMKTKSIGGFLARQGILIAFILFIVVFALWNPRFIDPNNVF